MDFYCPDCGRANPDSCADMKTMSAECIFCDTSISFAEVADGVDRAERRIPCIDKQVQMPDSISVTESVEELRIVKPWFTLNWIPVLALCCIWDFGVVRAWHAALMSDGASSDSGMPIFQAIIGLIATILTIQHCVNRTHIVVNASGLSSYSRPITFEQPKHIALDEIDQIYCRAERPASKIGRFEVVAIDTGGECSTIMQGLTEIGHARFIERRIETRLGISDRWIAGEFL